MKNPNRILVSEDTAVWRGIFTKLLKGESVEVIEAADLKTTLEALDHLFFNVAIVDLALDPKDESRLDGVETMRRIAKLGEGTQTIVLTGKGTVELAVSALKDFRVFHFLEKEKFDDDSFMAVLKEALSNGYRQALAPGRFTPPEALLGNMDWNKYASDLHVSRNDLESIFCGLIRESLPIVFTGKVLDVILDADKCTLSVQFWSKWFGRAVCVMAGRHEKLTVSDERNLIEKRELGKLCGLIVASDSSYDAFAK